MPHTWKELASFFEEQIQSISLTGKPEELYQPIDYTLQLGGKRIRPVLALMSAELFKQEAKVALPAALAVEVFHNFTLVHDDIMDEAPLRRGKASVHSKWGRDIAILSGDVMFVKAYQQLEKASKEQLPSLMKLFNQTAIEVCEGQQLDMNFEQMQTVKLEEYIQMIEQKTAVLLAASLQMGAICANAKAKDAQLLYDFGKNLGIAFQIQDDYLDAFADPEKFGKQVGGDILANKKTYLYLCAQNCKALADREELQKAYSHKNEKTKIEAVKACYVNSGAVEATKKAIAEYSVKALQALDEVGVMDANKSPLRELAQYLMSRGV
tara:strand:- start:176 stop:1147 length:972 start_codon:yes stop_codon:yes gene_type:complete